MLNKPTVITPEPDFINEWASYVSDPNYTEPVMHYKNPGMAEIIAKRNEQQGALEHVARLLNEKGNVPDSVRAAYWALWGFLAPSSYTFVDV